MMRREPTISDLLVKNERLTGENKRFAAGLQQHWTDLCECRRKAATVDSERAANAVLTEENAVLKAMVAALTAALEQFISDLENGDRENAVCQQAWEDARAALALPETPPDAQGDDGAEG